LWFYNDRGVQRALSSASTPAELKESAEDYLTYNQEIESGWLSDILNAYLSEVNWREVFEKVNEE
jgi:hypothetical protein